MHVLCNDADSLDSYPVSYYILPANDRVADEDMSFNLCLRQDSWVRNSWPGTDDAGFAYNDIGAKYSSWINLGTWMNQYASDYVGPIRKRHAHWLLSIKDLICTFLSVIALWLILQVMEEKLGGEKVVVRQANIHPERVKCDAE